LSWPDGTYVNPPGGVPLKLLSGAIPSSYTVLYYDGYYYAQTNIPDGTNYGPLADAETVIQNAIDALTTGGKIFLKGYDFDIGTTQLVLGPYTHLIGMGANLTSITYTGTAEAVIVKNGTDYCHWSGIKDLKVDAGASATAGIKLQNALYCVLEDVHVTGAPTDVPAIEIDATAGKFSASNQIRQPRISAFQFGIRYDSAAGANTCNHNILFGGSISRGGATDAGSRGLDILNGNANFVFGPDLDEFETGIYVDSAANQFFAPRIEATAGTYGIYQTANATNCVTVAPRFSGTITTKRHWADDTDCIWISGEGDDCYFKTHIYSVDEIHASQLSNQFTTTGDVAISQKATTGSYSIKLKTLNSVATQTDRVTIPSNTDEVAIDIHDNIIKNPKNHVASALSGTKKLVEIDIGGVPYYFEVYPTKA